MNDILLVGIDIGGTKCAACIGGADGVVRARREFPTAGGPAAMPDRALVLMELAWLANAVLSVVGFYGALEIGGIVTIAAAVLFATHAFTVVRDAQQRSFAAN